MACSTSPARWHHRVSEGLLGEQATDYLQGGQLSPDGRFVLFITNAPLIAADTNSFVDVYLRDRDADADGVFDEAGAVPSSASARARAERRPIPAASTRT